MAASPRSQSAANAPVRGPAGAIVHPLEPEVAVSPFEPTPPSPLAPAFSGAPPTELPAPVEASTRPAPASRTDDDADPLPPRTDEEPDVDPADDEPPVDD